MARGGRGQSRGGVAQSEVIDSLETAAAHAQLQSNPLVSLLFVDRSRDPSTNFLFSLYMVDGSRDLSSMGSARLTSPITLSEPAYRWGRSRLPPPLMVFSTPGQDGLLD